MKIARLVTTTALLAAAACTDVVLPPDLVLKCNDKSECPEQFTCRQQIGVCIADVDIEDVPPAVTDVVVAPALVRAGQDVTVAFKASETLFQLPVVELDFSQRAFAVSVDGDTITAIYRARGDEPAGDVAIRVGTLVDASGNVAKGLGLGAVRFDFAAPSVVEVTASALAQDRGVVKLRLRTDELVDSASSVVVADGRFFAADGPDDDDPLVSRFSLIADAAVDAEGAAAVVVTVVDAAGNSSERRFDDVFVLDFHAPLVTPQVRPAPAHFGAGSLANVSFTTDEVFSEPPTVVLASGDVELAMPGIERVGLVYAASRLIGAGDPDGAYEVRLIGYRDVAGNVGPPVVLDHVFVDATAPQFLNAPTTSATHLSRQAGRSSMVLSFALDEAAVVAVRVGTRSLNDCAPTGVSAPIAWQCSFDVVDSDTEGTADITVTATDSAGNSRFATAAPVTLDFTPPVLVSATATPLRGKPGDALVVAVIAAETLAAPPSLQVDGPGDVDFSAAGGSFLHNVTDADIGGNYTTTLTLVDVAGNAAVDVAGPSFSLDVGAPVLGVVAGQTHASMQPGRDVVTIAVTLSEPVRLALPDFDARIRGRAFDSCVENASPTDVLCTYQVVGDEAEGEAGISVVARDGAGNVGFAAAVVVFDFTAPALASATVSPLLARAGDNLVISLVGNEALAGSPLLHVAGPSALAFSPSGATFAHAVTGGDVAGSYLSSVDLMDLAGNRALDVAGPAFAVDVSTPAITVTSIEPAFASTVAGRDVVTVTLQLSEAADIDVSMGGRELSDCEADVDDALLLRCVYLVQGDEDEGEAGVSVVARDLAGNAGFASGSVVFDFTPPTLAAGSVSPAVARAGDDVVLSTTASETLAASPALRTNPALSFVDNGGTFHHSVVGSDANGAFATELDLEDLAGNRSTVAGPSFALDTSTPFVTIVDAPAFASRVAGRNVVSVSFVSSEPVLAGDVTALIDGRAFDGCLADGSDGFTCSYAVQAVDDDGEKGISIVTRDAAGNSGFAAASVAFDFTPPALTSAAASPALARPGDKIVLSIVTSEATLAPILRVSGPSALTFNAGANSGTFAHSVLGSDAEGSYTSELDLEDLAGNVATSVVGPGFRLDTSTPIVSAISATPAFASSAPSNDVVTLVLHSSEVPPPGGLSATIGARAFDSCTPGVDAHDITCIYAVRGNEDNGERGISVVVRDAAGNTGFGATAVTFDFIAPTATSSVSPAVGHPSDNLTIAVVPSEPIIGSPTLRVSGPSTLTFVNSGNSFSHAVVGGDVEGAYNSRIDLTDLAGNVATNIVGASFSLDTSVPVVTSINAAPAFASTVVGKNTVTLALHLSEVPPAGGLTTTIGGRAFDSCTAGVDPKDFTCSYRVLGTEGNGEKGISVLTRDAGGNTAFAAASVVFDFVAPTATTTVTPGLARPGDNVVFSVVPSEAIVASPVLRVTGPTTLSTIASGNTFNHLVVNGDTGGNYVSRIDLTDLAGNVATNIAGPGLTLDVSTPTISINSVSPAFASTVSGKNVVTLSLRVSERINLAPARLDATIGGRNFTSCIEQSDPLNVVCSYNVVGNEGNGTAGIALTARDAAGNVGFAGSSVVFDFVAPTTTSTVVPGLARPGDNVVLTFTPSETLALAPTLNISGPAPTPFFVGTGNTFTHTVGGSDAQGNYTSNVDLTDLAGNRSVGVAGPSFAFDTTTPSVTAFTVNPALASTAAGRSAVTISLTLSEALSAATAGAIVVTVAGNSVLCTDTASPLVKTCTYNVLGTEIPAATEATVAVAVALKDAAGNKGFASNSLALDFTGPAVVANSALIKLVPTDTNPLSTVTAVTTGTRVQLTFTLSEASSTPVVTTTAGSPSSLSFTKTSSTGTTFVFDHTLATTGQGVHSISVTATDLAGNQTVTNLTPTFTVDTSAPAAPSVGVADALVYKREPWGSDASDVTKIFRIAVASGAVAGSTVIAWDGPTPRVSGIEIGRSSVGGGGATVSLSGGDRPEVFVTAVDDAGNESDDVAGGALQATPVRDVSWTAGFGGKVVGSVLENPHEFQANPWSTDDLTTVAAIAGAASNGIDRSGTGKLTTTASPTWVNAGGLDTPGARLTVAAGFDAGRGKFVLFGEAERTKNDTWEWDGDSWTEAVPLDPEGDGKPSSARVESGGIVYDAAREKLVLFGGADSNETWEYDGHSWNRRCEGSPASDVCTLPPGRRNHRLAYDSRRAKVVLFGGATSFGLTTALADVWEWDGTTWTQRCDASPASDTCATKPSARYGNALAYDERTNRIVLVGGSGATGTTPFDDVWTWDGTTWTDVTSTPRPPARQGAVSGFLASRQEVVLFGGGTGDARNSGGTFFGDTWSFDGTRWVQLTPTDPEGDGDPEGRRYSGYATTARGLEMFAGTTLPGIGSCDGVVGGCHGIWRFDGTSWADLIPDEANDGNPANRRESAMAYDSARRRAVMFGGRNGDGANSCVPEGGGNGNCAFTWEWINNHWTKVAGIITGPNPTPAARFGHAMAYDSVRNVVVLFGGSGGTNCDGSGTTDCGGTWTWNGAVWTKQAPTTNPTARSSHHMAFDAQRGVVVMFGGKVLNNASCDGGAGCDDTWLWNGVNWAIAPVTDVENDGNPTERASGGMAFDDVRDEIVLVAGTASGLPNAACDGGSTLCDKTWTWNGTRWKKFASVPSQQRFLSAAFDRRRERVVAMGGTNGGGNVVETIGEWDGASWVNRTDVDPEADAAPVGRTTPAIAYDDFNGVTISFGGVTPDQNTWLFDGSAARSVSHQATFSFRSSGAATSATILSLTSSIIAGARGAAGSASANGADLFVWDGGFWRPVSSNTAPVTTPAALPFSSTDSAFLQRVFSGPDRALRFAIRGGDPSGASSSVSSVSTDLAEVTIKYRLP